MEAESKYAIKLAELEKSSRVDPKDMVTEQAAPPPEDVLAPDDLARQRLLGIAGAG